MTQSVYPVDGKEKAAPSNREGRGFLTVEILGGTFDTHHKNGTLTVLTKR
ncbi:hypothetical protein [Roseobacter weihaiensis]|nr:hypothetical protein [Roseobacter sp. H9]